VQGFANAVAEHQEPKQVLGKLHQDAPNGASTLWITYETSPIQDSYVGCQVGANPSPNLEGCFASDGNIIVISDLNVSYGYSYNVTKDNINDRTIQGFSTKAENRMEDCDTGSCPMPHFQTFRNYYGKCKNPNGPDGRFPA